MVAEASPLFSGVKEKESATKFAKKGDATSPSSPSCKSGMEYNGHQCDCDGHHCCCDGHAYPPSIKESLSQGRDRTTRAAGGDQQPATATRIGCHSHGVVGIVADQGGPDRILEIRDAREDIGLTKMPKMASGERGPKGQPADGRARMPKGEEGDPMKTLNRAQNPPREAGKDPEKNQNIARNHGGEEGNPTKTLDRAQNPPREAGTGPERNQYMAHHHGAGEGKPVKTLQRAQTPPREAGTDPESS